MTVTDMTVDFADVETGKIRKITLSLDEWGAFCDHLNEIGLGALAAEPSHPIVVGGCVFLCDVEEDVSSRRRAR